MDKAVVSIKNVLVMSVKKIINLFNKQIKRELVDFSSEEECPSYWHKTLFVESLDLSFEDWRKIQTDEYIDGKKSQYQKLKFLLKHIRKHKQLY